MTIQEYLDKITKSYKSGITSQQLYQGFLKILVESSAPDVDIREGPAKAACGTPDFVVKKGDIPVGYIEIFNIDMPLDIQGNTIDLDLCMNSLENLIFTNYLEFQLYRNGVLKSFASIAEINNGRIISKPEDHQSAEVLVKEFCSYQRVPIGSALNLSKTMANKAQLLACIIENAIIQDEKENKNQDSETTNTTLKARFTVSRNVLVRDVSPKDFADIIAQTISYGMFAARLYGPVMENFSRQKAAELIPEPNLLLRKLFQYLAGHDLDDRIIWIIEDLAEVFGTTDLATLLNDFKETAIQDDPFKHFHENFMDEYDPKSRENRSEFNKPEPIVAFIAEAVSNCISSKRF